MRRQVSPHLAPYIAFGATGSEAINTELNLRFRWISQMHGPILKPKLRIYMVAQLAAFVSDMCKRTTDQMAHQYVLFRCTKNWSIYKTSEEWIDWCRKCNAGESGTASFYIQDREVYAKRLAKWENAPGANRKDVKVHPKAHALPAEPGFADSAVWETQRSA